MPSSISNSRPRWFATWLLAMVLVAAGLATWESFWGGRSFEPSLSDDDQLWSLARQRANDLGRDAVVLVGTSRMQMNIHKETFAEATGWQPAVQLASVRGASVPVLASLAEDPEFRGVVIVEINPVLFFARTPRIDDVQRSYVKTFEDWNFAKAFEQRLRMWVQGNLVARLPSLAIEKLYQSWEYGRYPRPGYGDVIGEDRYRYGDYYKLPNLATVNSMNARLTLTTTPKLASRKGRALRLAKVKGWVEQIQERGGQVIFVHLPSAIHVLASEERWFEREKYWDVFANVIEAPAIHYQDHPSLANFRPPDGDHFDRGDALRFAEAFGRVLVQLSLAPGPDGTK